MRVRHKCGGGSCYSSSCERAGRTMADLVGVAGEEGKSMAGPVGAARLTFVLLVISAQDTASAQDKEAWLQG